MVQRASRLRRDARCWFGYCSFPPIKLAGSIYSGFQLPRESTGVILEAIITTMNDDGSANISPMGCLVDQEITSLVLRPYKSTRTFANLKRQGIGVLHVTDDVELIARAAVGQLNPPPKMVVHRDTGATILANCCRWYAFRATTIFDESDRTTVECEVTHQGRIRDFFGFNRAKYAVVEAAILATRLHILKPEDIRSQLKRLAEPVKKTAGDQERRAFDFLCAYIENGLQQANK